MKISKKIVEIVDKSTSNKEDIILYLLALYYFDYEASYIPEKVKEETNRLGIINRDYKKGTIHWVVPLFDSKNEINIKNDEWDWVDNEFRTLFSNIRSSGGGNKRSCYNKMRKYFSEHPEIRKQDVLDAATLYLSEFNNGKSDPQYMQRADYFISKTTNGIGGQTIESRLEMYLDMLKTDKSAISNINRRMKGVL